MPDRDRLFADDEPVGRHDDVADRVGIGRLIRDRVMFAGHGIAMRMRGERSQQRVVERIVGLLLHIVGQFDRIAARLHQGPGTSGDPHDVGIDGVEPAMAWAGGGGHVTQRSHRLRSDEAVAIPLRPAILQRDAVDHPVAHEPMIGGGIGGDRVRPDPEITAVEHRRDRSRHRQFVKRQFLGHRLVQAGEEGMRFGRFGEPFAVEVGDDSDPPGQGGPDDSFYGTSHATRSHDVYGINISDMMTVST